VAKPAIIFRQDEEAAITYFSIFERRTEKSPIGNRKSAIANHKGGGSARASVQKAPGHMTGKHAVGATGKGLAPQK